MHIEADPQSHGLSVTLIALAVRELIIATIVKQEGGTGGPCVMGFRSMAPL